MSEYICTKCDKNFKAKRNLEYHIEKQACKIKNHDCKFCNKSFTTSTSMYRHMKHTCKRKDIDSNDTECTINQSMGNILERLIKLEEENKKIKSQNTQVINENKILKRNFFEKETNMISNTTNNNSNCNINNGTVNNIYLVGYGKEDMAMIDHNELLRSIKMGFNSTYNLIDTVHFNPDYPEFHNVYISSMKNKYAMMYDGNNWALVMKDALIDKMYDDKRNYIEENLDDFLDSLTPSQQRALHRWMDVDDDHDYIRKIKNDIKLLLYNKRKMPINNKGKIVEYIDEELDIGDIDSEIKDTTSIIIIPKNSANASLKKQRSKPARRTGTKRKILRVKRAA